MENKKFNFKYDYNIFPTERDTLLRRIELMNNTQDTIDWIEEKMNKEKKNLE